MDTLSSEKKEPYQSGRHVQTRFPLSGEKLALAIAAMEVPGFLKRLTARIMNLARAKGFHSPFEDTMDLPGGKSVADLADDIIEKSLDGTFNWDQDKHPDFYHFCLSRAESILSNWLKRMRRFETVSPLPAKDPDLDALCGNPLNLAIGVDDVYTFLRVKEGGALGDRFLQDFALSLPDGSHEQSIILAVFDDRECANRAYCRGKLGISERDYDAAIKRLLRAIPSFLKAWCVTNKINPPDWSEAR